MKNSIRMKTGAAASAVVAVAGVTCAFLLAGGTAQNPGNQTSLSVLSRASGPDLPAVAARLVAEAAPEARDATAAEVVRAANSLVSPTALPFVVGAVCQAAPESATAALAEATRLQPDVSLACVQSATVAAPSQTAAIVAQAAKDQPAAYARVALVASAAAPSRSAEVLSGLSAGLPQVQPLVDRAVSQTPSVTPSVPVVIAQVSGMVASAARGELATVTPSGATTPEVFVPLANGTQQGPPVVTPLTPPVVPPGDKTLVNTIPQSGNTRDYSAP